jgi:hypothetical protein
MIPITILAIRNSQPISRNEEREMVQSDRIAIEHEHRFTEQEHEHERASRTKPCTEVAGRRRLTW